MASSSARASRASCFFRPENVNSILGPARAAGGRVQAAPDLARQRAQVRALERGPGALVTAQRGDERGLLGGPRVRVDANAGAALDRLPHLRGGGRDAPGRPAANPRDPPEPFRPGREDLADRLQARVYERGERDLPAGQVPEPVDRHRVKRVGDEPVAHRLVRPAGDLAGLPRRGQDRLDGVVDRAAVGDDGPGRLPRARAARLRGARPQLSPVPGSLSVLPRAPPWCESPYSNWRSDDHLDRGYRRHAGNLAGFPFQRASPAPSTAASKGDGRATTCAAPLKAKDVQADQTRFIERTVTGSL